MGAGALGLAFNLDGRAEWLIVMGVVALCGIGAVTILVVEHRANAFSNFAFIVPVLIYSLRGAQARKRISKGQSEARPVTATSPEFSI